MGLCIASINLYDKLDNEPNPGPDSVSLDVVEYLLQPNGGNNMQINYQTNQSSKSLHPNLSKVGVLIPPTGYTSSSHRAPIPAPTSVQYYYVPIYR